MSRGTALMLFTSGLGIAGGICLALAAHNDDVDADAAAKYDDHERISARANREYIGAIAAGGVGVALGVIAVMRIKGSNEGTQLSLRPRTGGGTLVLERSW